MTMMLKPRTVRDRTVRGESLMNQHTILIVGAADKIEILAHNHNSNIVFAANYEEATEQLKRARFGHVITDAVLPDGRTGMDILRLMRMSMTKKSGHCATVCHTETSCEADGQKWNIKPSLSASFTFAQFYQGTIDDYWVEGHEKKCA